MVVDELAVLVDDLIMIVVLKVIVGLMLLHRRRLLAAGCDLMDMSVLVD